MNAAKSRTSIRHVDACHIGAGDLRDTFGDRRRGVAQTVWSIARWPLILILMILAVATLYYATPNVQPLDQRRGRRRRGAITIFPEWRR
jgi:hypothetical protein